VNCPWCFGEKPTDNHPFDVVTVIPESPTVQAERERLKDDLKLTWVWLCSGRRRDLRGRDHGATSSVSEGRGLRSRRPGLCPVRSDLGTLPLANKRSRQPLHFPVSSIQAVTSSVGTQGSMMQFEGGRAIYSSTKGVAATTGEIGSTYTEEYDSTTAGWVFPWQMSRDTQSHYHSTV